MSAPVTTACTPSSASAAEVSIEVDVGVREGAAHECHVQHVRPHDVVDVTTRPVRKRGSSMRFPARRRTSAGRCRRRQTSPRSDQLGRVQHGVDDERVARAAADVPLQCDADLVGGGRRVALQQGLRGQHHAGRAEAALQPVLLPERLLHRMQRLGVGAEPSIVVDLGAVGLHREQQARAHRVAIEQHRAGAADALLAAHVGAGQAEVLADEVGQQLARLGLARAPVPLMWSVIVRRVMSLLPARSRASVRARRPAPRRRGWQTTHRARRRPSPGREMAAAAAGDRLRGGRRGPGARPPRPRR